MSAQIIAFPTTYMKVCRVVNGRMQYRMVAGLDIPKGWSLVVRHVDTKHHNGWVA